MRGAALGVERRACCSLERRSDGDRRSGVPAAVLVRMRSEEGRQGRGQVGSRRSSSSRRDDERGGGEMGIGRG